MKLKFPSRLSIHSHFALSHPRSTEAAGGCFLRIRNVLQFYICVTRGKGSSLRSVMISIPFQCASFNKSMEGEPQVLGGLMTKAELRLGQDSSHVSTASLSRLLTI